jgi:trehalose-6-phosphate synthase
LSNAFDLTNQGAREEMDFLWIGWLGGVGVPEGEQALVASRLEKDFKCIPVFLDDELVDKYYNGFRQATVTVLLEGARTNSFSNLVVA